MTWQKAEGVALFCDLTEINLETTVIEQSVRARIIIASSSLSDKTENSNKSQSDIIEEVALSLCNLVQLV